MIASRGRPPHPPGGCCRACRRRRRAGPARRPWRPGCCAGPRAAARCSGRGDPRREARDRAEHVDGREVPDDGEPAVHHDVPVEDRPGRVGDRLVVVVAVDEHRVHAGDRADLAGARALEQLREQGERRRRVAAGGRRLADREADLALGHRDAGQRVHHQHHVRALVAERLRDAGGDEGGAQAHDRGLVRGRDDHDRAREALGAEVVLEELAHLAAALPHQRDHRDLGLGAARDHRQQRRLADARAGEQAEPLTAPDGDEGVQHAHAQAERGVDPRPAHGLAARGGRGARKRPARSGPCRRRVGPGRR